MKNQVETSLTQQLVAKQDEKQLMVMSPRKQNRGIERNESGIEVLLTYPKAIKLSFLSSLDFFSAKIVPFSYNLTSGIVVAQLSDVAVAASSLTSTIEYVIQGSIRSGFQYLNVLMGNSTGAGQNNTPAIVQRAWWLATAASLFIVIPLFNLSPLFLKLLNIPDVVIDEVKTYFIPASLGALPMVWLACDLYSALTIQRKKLRRFLSTVPWLLSMAIGYPLALNAFQSIGLSNLNLSALAWGDSAGSWIALIMLRLYYHCNSTYRVPRLLSCPQENNFKEYLTSIKTALPFIFQSFSEWVNIFAISLMSNLLGPIAIASSITSLRLITMTHFFTFAFNQAINTQLSIKKGDIDAVDKSKNDETLTKRQNLVRLGNAGIVLGAVATAIAAGLFIVFNNQLTETFTHISTQAQEIYDQSRSLIIINSIGLVLDCIRSNIAGALSGIGILNFSPIVSFIGMSVTALPLGYYTSLNHNSIYPLFLARTGGILLSTLILLANWKYQSGKLLNNTNETKKGCCLFKKTNTQTQSNEKTYEPLTAETPDAGVQLV